jgi:PAS domain S-box-containing protein
MTRVSAREVSASDELVVLVIAPSGRDAELIVSTLRKNGVDAERHADLAKYPSELESGSIGALLLTEEALDAHLIEQLAHLLHQQEPWSDLPVILLTTAGRESLRSRRLHDSRSTLGEPILLERPIRAETLLATVRAALRSRQKQYAIRDALRARDHALEELRVERETLQSILDSLPVGVLMATPDGKIVRGNRAAEGIFRHPMLPTPDISAHGQWIAFHSDGRRVQSDEYPLPRAIKSRHAIPAEEVLYQRGDGSLAWISLSAAPILGEQGHLLGGVVAVSDVDQQRRASEQLRKSEDRFRRLIETSSVGLLIGDLQGGISYINPTLLNLLGYTAEEVASGSVLWSQLTPSEFADRDALAITELQQTGSATPYEKVYLSKAGRRIPLLVGTTLIPGQDESAGDSVAVFLTDLSQQKLAESALVRSEKLAAVGRLAASISHEINNPLEAITNLLFLLKQEPLPAQAAIYLQLAEEELARVSQIAGQTLRFHRQATRARAIQPVDLLEPVLVLYRGRLNNSNIQICLENLDARPIVCFEGDIRQVLNNLVSNAIDAMRTGGLLTIRIRNAASGRNGLTGVRITISDTGHGMPEETRLRIFEPFYTTKGINGTGLGLWISHGIIEKHQGSLSVRSSVDPARHGTTFSLFLPGSDAD